MSEKTARVASSDNSSLISAVRLFDYYQKDPARTASDTLFFMYRVPPPVIILLVFFHLRDVVLKKKRLIFLML